MRNRFPVLALICAAAGIGLYFFLHSAGSPANLSGEQPVQTPRPETALLSGRPKAAVQNSTIPDPLKSATPAPEQTAAVTAAVPVPSTPVDNLPDSSGLTPVKVVENMRSTIREYGLRFGGNPVGINQEITAALNGRNPKQVNFIRPEAGLRLNDNGELIDPWGTPYFFHQLSALQMEVRSAGPDKTMWTGDDLVAR